MQEIDDTDGGDHARCLHQGQAQRGHVPHPLAGECAHGAAAGGGVSSAGHHGMEETSRGEGRREKWCGRGRISCFRKPRSRCSWTVVSGMAARGAMCGRSRTGNSGMRSVRGTWRATGRNHARCAPQAGRCSDCGNTNSRRSVRRAWWRSSAGCCRTPGAHETGEARRFGCDRSVKTAPPK